MKSLLTLFLLLVVFATGTQASIIVVRDDGLGSYPTIQEAIDASSDGDEIWLIAGVFTGPGNRDIDLRDRNVLITSMDNDPATCIIDCEAAGPTAPHRAFIIADTDVQNTTIRGVTMRNGYATGGGGAVHIIAYASATFENCVFEDNATGMTDWHGGGAVYADRTTAPVFNDCVFRNNQGFAGGALNSNHGGRVTLNRCRFIGNRAVRGGAVYGITTEKVGCLFADNEAEVGGAIWHNSAGSDYYENCTLDGNRAATGGAVFASSNYGGPMVMIDTIISNCPEGAAMVVYAAVPLTISCSNFYGNAGGDWTAPFADQVDLRGNFSANPCYCDADGGDFQLSGDSYARAGGHPWGCDQRVGAYGVGCGDIGCSGPVAIEAMTFGTMKSMYR